MNLTRELPAHAYQLIATRLALVSDDKGQRTRRRARVALIKILYGLHILEINKDPREVKAGYETDEELKKLFGFVHY